MDELDFETLKHRVEAMVRPAPALLTYWVLLSLLSLFAFPFVFLPHYFKYLTLQYRFHDEGVSMRFGLLFRRELHLTFARMQDIHVSQDLLERWLGIGRVTIQTAGGGSGGDLTLLGLTEFEPVRDYLYLRMRGVREPAGAARPAARELGGSTEALLRDIRDELRAAARALAGGTERPR